MRSNKDDQDRAHSDWVASMSESHITCRQALMQATVDVSDPRQALWPALPARSMTKEQQTVAQCHAAVLDYAEHIKPHKNKCSRYWTEDVATAHEFPEGDELSVALSDIDKWADRRYERKVGRRDELTGKKEEKKIERVYLPTAYARELFSQLNRCRERLQLAADIENQTFNTEQRDPGLGYGNGQ